MKLSPWLAFPILCKLLVLATLATPLPRPDHIVIVMEENHGYSQIIGSPSAPYINSLASSGALFTQSFAVEHPSQPNYLDIFSGTNQGVTDDSCPHTFSAANLGAQLLQAGFTFIGYAEDLPAAGSTACTSGAFARKHTPWVDWIGASANAIPSASDQPFTAFPTDFTQLPKVSMLAPNLNDDMHDGTIAAGDSWLQTHLDAYAQWAMTHNSLLIVTFDENDGSSGNQIATIFHGGVIKSGQYSEHINHYNILRTIEDMYGLPHAGNAANVNAITDCWSIKFETENLAVAATSGDTHRIIDDPQFSGGEGTILDANAVGDFVSYNVPGVAAGTYDVRIGIKKFNPRGIFQLEVSRLDGTGGTSFVGPAVDEYSATTLFTEVDLGSWTPGSTSDKAFKFAVTGKNAASSGYSIAFDYIKLTPRITVPNSGFEAPVTSTFVYNPAGGSWTFNKLNPGGSGISANHSAFTSANPVAPEGLQVGFLQDAGAITQALAGFTPGLIYTVTFSAAQRNDGQTGQTWNVTLDGAVIKSFAPAKTATSYVDYTAIFTASAASHTLGFVGTNLNGGDNTIFLDNIRVGN